MTREGFEHAVRAARTVLVVDPAELRARLLLVNDLPGTVRRIVDGHIS